MGSNDLMANESVRNGLVVDESARNDLMANDPARDDMLVLVDALDREVGAATKWRTHVEALMHRAFSVVLYREGEAGPELLLAKRSLRKYHSGGLWANSCCSHPRVGEDVIDAAYRRVHEELGCTAVNLRELAAFAYYAEVDNGLVEFEYDHVIIGNCEGEFSLDPAEASEVRWIDFEALAAELAASPKTFGAWVPMVLSMTMAALRD